MGELVIELGVRTGPLRGVVSCRGGFGGMGVVVRFRCSSGLGWLLWWFAGGSWSVFGYRVLMIGFELNRSAWSSPYCGRRVSGSVQGEKCSCFHPAVWSRIQRPLVWDLPPRDTHSSIASAMSR